MVSVQSLTTHPDLKGRNGLRFSSSCRRATAGLNILAVVILTGGCYAPLLSPGVSPRVLPDSFRYPERTLAPRTNYANLTISPPEDYLLGANDILAVTVPDLFPGSEVRPLTVQVMASGQIQLPLAGPVDVGGKNLLEAQQAITQAYAEGILAKPSVSVALGQKETFEVVVLGQVEVPSTVPLPRYQNDVGHALSAAHGLTREAADFVEIHRRVGPGEAKAPPEVDGSPIVPEQLSPAGNALAGPRQILRIPLRGLPPGVLSPEDITLKDGDVVFVPSREFEVFWVVGQLDVSNLVRFGVGREERELGAGLILPRERDIDVITAVSMAGYLDPIDSPFSVTVQRRLPTGESILIRVNMIKARNDPRETVLIKAGDIIYVNPTPAWWFRRQWDRIAGQVFLIPYNFTLSKAFFQ